MRTVSRLALVPVLLALAAAPGYAKHHKKEAKTVGNCPVCKMALTDKKTATNTKAIKVGKKTVFCCSACDMSSLDKGDKKKDDKK